MRFLTAPLALVALVGCYEPTGSGLDQAQGPVLADVSASADSELDLVSRSEVLADANDHDQLAPGEPLDLADLPAGFLMDFDGEAITDTVPNRRTATYINASTATLAVAAADLIVAGVVLPPATAIAIAADGTITQTGVNVWEATNTIPLNGVDITGRFTVAWVGVGWLAEMRLTTSDGRYTDDLWFNGFLAYGGGLGWWDLYDGHNLVGVIEWIGDGQGNAQFGLAAVAGPHSGDWLSYVFGADGFARVDAYDSATAQQNFVQLNPDQSGFVRLADYNGGAPACWATDFTDALCP